MVTVNFCISEDGKSLILNVTGHAGQNDIGKDIVCSATSILAYTVAQVACDMYRCKKLKKKPTIEMESGNANIVVKPIKDNFDEALHTFYVAETGYRLLAHNYPQYVQLNGFDRGN